MEGRKRWGQQSKNSHTLLEIIHTGKTLTLRYMVTNHVAAVGKHGTVEENEGEGKI